MAKRGAPVATASVAALMRLCETLSISVGSLFPASTAEASDPRAPLAGLERPHVQPEAMT
jgi:hypothetical protein